MSTTKQASVPPVALPPEIDRMLEDWEYTTTPKMALLIKWFEAESTADQAGGESTLDRLAWLSVEHLLRDALCDMETLLKVSGAQSRGFVTLADDEGGARGK